jgi:hypothetical protein
MAPALIIFCNLKKSQFIQEITFNILILLRNKLSTAVENRVDNYWFSVRAFYPKAVYTIGYYSNQTVVDNPLAFYPRTDKNVIYARSLAKSS